MTSGNLIRDEDDSPAYLHTLDDNSVDIPMSKSISMMLKKSVKVWIASPFHSIVDISKNLYQTTEI